MTINVTTEKLVKTLQLTLLLAIFGLLIWSKPWDNTSSDKQQRTITVSGQSTIEAEPDEFTFTPYFQQTGSDKDALLSELTTKSNAIVDKLKELGVEEKNIKLDASSYDRWYWEADQEGVLSVSLTIKATDDELVQSIQDYLLTTGAEGQLTPRATFSEAKQEELDTQAVEEASADARSKAEAQAMLFDAKLGDVISVNQQNDSLFGYPEFAINSIDISESAESLPVLPGQNDYTQTVNVVYELQ